MLSRRESCRRGRQSSDHQAAAPVMATTATQMADMTSPSARIAESVAPLVRLPNWSAAMINTAAPMPPTATVTNCLARWGEAATRITRPTSRAMPAPLESASQTPSAGQRHQRGHERAPRAPSPAPACSGVAQQHSRPGEQGARPVPVADRVGEPTRGVRDIAVPTVEHTRLEIGEQRHDRDETESGGQPEDPLGAARPRARTRGQHEEPEEEGHAHRLFECASLVARPADRCDRQDGGGGEAEAREGRRAADLPGGQRAADQTRYNGGPDHDRGGRVAGGVEESLGQSGAEYCGRNQPGTRVLFDRRGQEIQDRRSGKQVCSPRTEIRDHPQKDRRTLRGGGAIARPRAIGSRRSGG